MALNKEQIKELLGNGIDAVTVASVVGCDTSYISQLMSEDSFAGEVSALRAVALTSHTKRDASLDAVEDKLIAQLGELVDQHAFFKPRDVLSALAVVNRAVRRGVPAGQQNIGTAVQTIVNINLPTVARQKYTTNRQNEVIQVDEQTLVTMPAHVLLKRLAEQKSEAGQDVGHYEEAAKYLPSGIESKIITR